MQGGRWVARRYGHPIGRKGNLHLQGSGGHWHQRKACTAQCPKVAGQTGQSPDGADPHGARPERRKAHRAQRRGPEQRRVQTTTALFRTPAR